MKQTKDMGISEREKPRVVNVKALETEEDGEDLLRPRLKSLRRSRSHYVRPSHPPSEGYLIESG